MPPEALDLKSPHQTYRRSKPEEIKALTAQFFGAVYRYKVILHIECALLAGTDLQRI